jgi:hypothetical protein
MAADEEQYEAMEVEEQQDDEDLEAFEQAEEEEEEEAYEESKDSEEPLDVSAAAAAAAGAQRGVHEWHCRAANRAEGENAGGAAALRLSWCAAAPLVHTLTTWQLSNASLCGTCTCTRVSLHTHTPTRHCRRRLWPRWPGQRRPASSSSSNTRRSWWTRCARSRTSAQRAGT